MALWINYDPKTSTFYSFWKLCQQLNDFNDFGVGNAEKIWHKNLIDLFTSPVRCSQFTENGIKIYSRALFIRTTTTRRVGTRVSHYQAVEPLVYISSCWDAGQLLQGCGTARLHLVVLGRGSAATRLWNRWSTSRRVGTRVSRYTAVEPLVYVSSCWEAGQPLQSCGTARFTLHSAS